MLNLGEKLCIYQVGRISSLRQSIKLYSKKLSVLASFEPNLSRTM